MGDNTTTMTTQTDKQQAWLEKQKDAARAKYKATVRLCDDSLADSFECAAAARQKAQEDAWRHKVNQEKTDVEAKREAWLLRQKVAAREMHERTMAMVEAHHCVTPAAVE